MLSSGSLCRPVKDRIAKPGSYDALFVGTKDPEAAQKADTQPASAAQAADVEKILKIVTQTQDELKALEATVASLSANQKDQTAQMSLLLKDVA